MLQCIVPRGERLTLLIPIGELRAAFGTGIRLGVKAAIIGVVVFRLAGGAKGEAGHRRVATVIGQGIND